MSMLRKTRKACLFLSIFLLLGPLYAKAQENAGRSYHAKRFVLVVHDLTEDAATGITIQDLKTTLRHFDAFVKDVPLGRYGPGQIDDYDVVFYVGAKEHSSAELGAFLQDLLRSYRSKIVCWVNADVGYFLPLSGLKGRVAVSRPAGIYSTLRYKNATFKSSSARLPHLIRAAAGGGNGFATYGSFVNEKDGTPFAFNAGKFWYFSILPDNKDDFLVFCDLLHPVLLEGKEHDAEPGKTAFLVLEGVDAATDLEKFSGVIQTLWENGVPYMVGIKPIRYGSEGEQILSKKNYLLRNLVPALSLGGTALLQADSLLTHRRVNDQVAELIRSDILPLAFLDISGTRQPGPNYPAEDNFSTFVGFQKIPFFSYDEKFQALVPISMDLSGRWDNGYLIAEREAERRCVLRDAVLGVAIDVHADKKQVISLIKRLKGLGYAFLDLKCRPNYVRTERAIIVSEPYYYEDIPVDELVYGNKRKIDPIRFPVTNEFLVETLLSQQFKLISEKAYAMRLTGTALIDMPDQRGIFLAGRADTKPTAVEKIEKPLLAFLLGKSSRGPMGDVYRLIVMALFLVTFILMVYLLWMYLFEEWVRKTFRGI